MHGGNDNVEFGIRGLADLLELVLRRKECVDLQAQTFQQSAQLDQISMPPDVLCRGYSPNVDLTLDAFGGFCDEVAKQGFKRNVVTPEGIPLEARSGYVDRWGPIVALLVVVPNDRRYVITDDLSRAASNHRK